jgi:hypothetical protein
MIKAALPSWSPLNFSRMLASSLRAVANILLIAIVTSVIRSSAQNADLPDYFATSEAVQQSQTSGASRQELTQGEADELISSADHALQKLAQGDSSAALSFASLFDTTVDYYDEGQRTPQQIAQEKAAIFRSYHSYTTQRVGELTLKGTDRPDVKWVNFAYRYEILKKSGAILRGAAEARWELQKSGGKVLVIATREVTQRQ